MSDEVKKEVSNPILLMAGLFVLAIGLVMLFSGINGLSNVPPPSGTLWDEMGSRNDQMRLYNSLAIVSFPIIGAGFFMTMFGLVIRALRELK